MRVPGSSPGERGPPPGRILGDALHTCPRSRPSLGGATYRLSLPPPPPWARQAAALLWDTNTQVIRSPDQSQRPTARLSMVPLCRRKPARELESRERGRGRRTKILVTREKSQKMRLKRLQVEDAPGLPAGRCEWRIPGSAEKKTLSLLVSEETDDTGRRPEERPLSALLP